MDFFFIAVAAGDQQVLAERQEFFRAFVGGAFGQFGQDARFGKVGGGDRRQWQQLFAHGVADLVLAQAATAASAQDRVADQRQVRVRLEQFDHGVDHFQGPEHAQLDRRDRRILEYGVGLGQYPLAIEHAEIADIDRILHGQRGDSGSCMTALGEQGFDICLEAGATTGIMAGETEDNGTRAVDIHGARAYHQTPFSESSAQRAVRFLKLCPLRPIDATHECDSIAEKPVLEPLDKMFQWCALAIIGYARVDPNE